MLLVFSLLIAVIYAQGTNPLDDAATLATKQLILDYHNWQRSFSALGLVPGPTPDCSCDDECVDDDDLTGCCDANSCTHPAGGNILNLMWDDGLSDIAFDYSTACEYMHNPDKTEQAYTARDTLSFKIDQFTKYVGENIGYGSIGSQSVNATVQTLDGLMAMFQESEGYVLEEDECTNSPCGHYTQMAWGDTRYIGCGWSLCETLYTDCDADNGCDQSKTQDWAIFFVCNYWPGGNVYSNNQLADIYTFGDDISACDDCPWDHNSCSADTTPTYDADWHNTPSYSDSGLCMGCGNSFFAICNEGSTQSSCDTNTDIDGGGIGCGAEWPDADSNGEIDGQVYCDMDNDPDYFSNIDGCIVARTCKYQCNLCDCSELCDSNCRDDKTDCAETCDDGLGRSISGGCDVDYWDNREAATGDDICLDENPNGSGGDGGVVVKSTWCFASDSYVYTEGYIRKQISDINVGDKILTYDDINDEYIFDELIVKLHFDEGESLNDVLVPMIELVLDNSETLTMSDIHLLYIGNSGLHRADQVQIGDKLKQYDGSYASVIEINNVEKYPRNLVMYSSNLVINGCAISTFTDTIWGESKYFGQTLRFLANHLHKYNIWRYPVYYVTQFWNYLSLDSKNYIYQYVINTNENDDKQDSHHWFSTIFSV